MVEKKLRSKRKYGRKGNMGERKYGRTGSKVEKEVIWIEGKEGREGSMWVGGEGSREPTVCVRFAN
jgi:hypothetical protein